MEEVMLDIRNWNRWMKDRFPNKDIITLENLLADYEDLICENENLEEQLDKKNETISEMNNELKHYDPVNY